MTPHLFPNRNTLALVALLLAALAAGGCDTKKGERAALMTKIKAAEADMSSMKDEQARVSREIENFTSQIKEMSASLQQSSQRRTKLQDELSAFVLDHKLATAAVAATAGSVAGILDENVEKGTKEGLALVAIVGGLYCLSNADECADVTARVTYFGSQIEAEGRAITDVTSRLSRGKSSLQEREKQLSSLSETIGKRLRERDSLQQDHDKLLCKFCL